MMVRKCSWRSCSGMTVLGWMFSRDFALILEQMLSQVWRTIICLVCRCNRIFHNCALRFLRVLWNWWKTSCGWKSVGKNAIYVTLYYSSHYVCNLQYIIDFPRNMWRVRGYLIFSEYSAQDNFGWNEGFCWLQEHRIMYLMNPSLDTASRLRCSSRKVIPNT